MIKLKVRFSALDFKENIELKLRDDWVDDDIEDAYENWLHDIYGEGWEILDEYEK